MKRKSNTSIETLIGNIKGLSFTQSAIDQVINDMQIVKINPNDQWEILQENYSKLKYLHSLVVVEGVAKFTQKLYQFMESIDEHTMEYLREIDFYDHNSDYRIECYVIKELLENSLIQSNLLNKLEIILKAYQILIVIVEQIRNQKYQEIVDIDFVQLFKKQQI